MKREQAIEHEGGRGHLLGYVRPGDIVLDLRFATGMFAAGNAGPCPQALLEKLPVADGALDVVTSDCVLGLVDEKDRGRLIREFCRVLKPNGRLAISDLVAGAPVPGRLQGDSGAWSGFIGGVFAETEFLKALADAGFAAMRVESWADKPCRRVEGIEFRLITVTAIKSERAAGAHRGHIVIYRGPYAEVRDDDQQAYPRGERVAVCERTFRRLAEGPHKGDFVALAPAGDEQLPVR